MKRKYYRRKKSCNIYGTIKYYYTKNGLVKLELDNELIQGATVEVEYEIKVTNNSELDYVSEDFYKYGIKSGNEVTITPTSIIDYLDKIGDLKLRK